MSRHCTEELNTTHLAHLLGDLRDELAIVDRRRPKRVGELSEARPVIAKESEKTTVTTSLGGGSLSNGTKRALTELPLLPRPRLGWRLTAVRLQLVDRFVEAVEDELNVRPMHHFTKESITG